MKILVIALGLEIFAGSVIARPENRMISASSVSGQFVAYERQPSPFQNAAISVQPASFGQSAFVLPSRPASSSTNTGLILEPILLVISCERIKEEFLAGLGLTDAWSSRIELLIDRDFTPGQIPILTASRSRREWAYKLELPKTIQPQALMRALVGALLVEIANRGAGAESAEVPLWLVEGMSAHLEANSLPTLLLQLGAPSPGDHVTLAGQTAVRRFLRDRPPLSFQQLSWPASLENDSDKAFFRACSQLFVEELLNLKNGPAALCDMLQQLGHDRNWQTAFLAAYHVNFSSLLDVEKWWCVTCVDFRSADSGEFASMTEVWRNLQDTLDVPVEVRLASTRMPAEARLTLQEAISKWDPSAAETAVQRAIVRLELQRYRASPDLRPMMDAYIITLSNYLEGRRSLERKADFFRNPAAQLAVLRGSTCKQLDALDAQREQIRAKILPPKDKNPRLSVSNASSTRRGNTSP